MPRSKRSYEGELLIDHRFTPGIPEEVTHRQGLPVGAAQGLFEAPTFTCSHCQKVVVLNPLRNRERAWCRKCDHYLCDPCGGILHATGICRPYRAMLDDLQEKGLKLEGQDDGQTIIRSTNINAHRNS